MPSFYHVTAMGHLGRDPETKESNGKSYTKFSFAHSTKRGGDEKTMWVDCTAFGKTGELIAQHFSKGDAIIVFGDGQPASYKKKDGTQVETLELIVQSWSFAGGKKDGGTTRTTEKPKEDEVVQDDLPF